MQGRIGAGMRAVTKNKARIGAKPSINTYKRIKKLKKELLFLVKALRIVPASLLLLESVIM